MKSRTQGFTLIELLVALGIAIVLFSLLFIPMRSALDGLSQAQARTELQRNGQAILSQIVAELHSAVGVFNNDAPRTTVPKPFTPGPGTRLTLDLDGDGFPEDYSMLQVIDTSAFSPGMSVTVVERNASGAIVNQEVATIIDISEPTNDPNVCGGGSLFRNLPSEQLTCAPPNTLLLARATNNNNKELTNSYPIGSDVIGPFPYIDSANRGTLANQNRVGLTSRLDFIVARGLTAGTIPATFPLTPETVSVLIGASTVELPVIVTYYVRKREMRLPYDPIDNPLLLYRAQYVPRLGLGATLDQRLQNGCWRLDNVNFNDTRGSATDAGCDPFSGQDAAKAPLLTPDPSVNLGVFHATAHGTLTPISDVDMVGRCVDGRDPTDPNFPDCGDPNNVKGYASKLVTDTNFIVHRQNGRSRVTINLMLGRYDRSRHRLHKVQMQTDVDISNAQR
jgi:prepilin-type N-terminal cleavage/methylation domain-containing protein